MEQLRDFEVIELRRYLIKAGVRDEFACYFETYFPEAFQQLGSIIFGQFLERDNPAVFTWLRGFHSMEERATLNQAFYSGPLWSEHGSKMNERLIDHTNVLLLRPLNREHRITIFPAVDPVRERAGAQGVVVAQIFPLKADKIEAFVRQAEVLFSRYQQAGIQEAGVLITLDVPNNFPRLPFRTDGPYLVWLGISKANQVLEDQFMPLIESVLPSLLSEELLRAAPELVVLDPTPRSRLRYLER